MFCCTAHSTVCLAPQLSACSHSFSLDLWNFTQPLPQVLAGENGRNSYIFKDFIHNFTVCNCWLFYHWELWCFPFSSEVFLHRVATTFSSVASNKYYMSDIWALHLTITKILLIAEPEVLLDEKPTVLTSMYVKCLFIMKYLKNDHSVLAGSNFSSSTGSAKAPIGCQCNILSTE